MLRAPQPACTQAIQPQNLSVRKPVGAAAMAVELSLVPWLNLLDVLVGQGARLGQLGSDQTGAPARV